MLAAIGCVYNFSWPTIQSDACHRTRLTDVHYRQAYAYFRTSPLHCEAEPHHRLNLFAGWAIKVTSLQAGEVCIM